MKKILVVTGELNPGPLALATTALTTELRQPSTSKSFTFYFFFYEGLELGDCNNKCFSLECFYEGLIIL